MRKFLISIIGALSIYSAFAAGENIPTSKSYVDAAIATKQDIISATTGASQVLTNTGTAGEYGTKEIYDSNATYGEQTDALIDAITMNTAVQNAIDSEFQCVEYDDHGECLLMDVFGTPPQSILPTGYTALEYLESTGTQYIDTGVTQSTRAIINMQATPTTSEVVMFMYAPINATGYENGFGQYKNALAGFSQHNISKKTRYDISYDASSITLTLEGSAPRRATNYYIATNSRIALFGSSPNTPYNRKITGKLYSAEIFNGGALIRNFVPARRNSDGVLGMYDTVTNAFFINNGTGEFIAGPIVYIPQSN